MAEATIAHQITRLRQRHSAPLILELDLTQGIVEGPPTDPLNAVLTRNRLRLGDMLDGLRRAREDDRVQALVAKVGGQNLGLATVQAASG
jgi:protease-4